MLANLHPPLCREVFARSYSQKRLGGNRMILRFLSAFALFTPLFTQALTLARETTADAAEIERLIAQLGSVKFTEREAASKRLEACGEPALSALRNAMITSSDAEMRQRAGLLIDAINQRVLPPGASPQGMSVSPDGRYVADGSYRGFVDLFRLGQK